MSDASRDDRIYRQIDRKMAQFEGRIGRDIKIWGGVLDKQTVMALHRLLRNGVLGSLDFPISTGKEADVFKGTDGDGSDVAVKVYRYATPTFQKVLQYVQGDPRFRSVPRDRRALVQAWAKKEFRNLERFRAVLVDVPLVYRHLENVIVMEYLAGREGPARTMKDEHPEDPRAAYEKVWGDYRRILEKATSVHADFSEYNCLMVDGVPRLIDCGQAVLNSHPMADEFLARDVRNLARFFTRLGVDLDAEAMLLEARGLKEAGEPEDDEEEVL